MSFMNIGHLCLYLSSETSSLNVMHLPIFRNAADAVMQVRSYCAYSDSHDQISLYGFLYGVAAKSPERIKFNTVKFNS